MKTGVANLAFGLDATGSMMHVSQNGTIALQAMISRVHIEAAKIIEFGNKLGPLAMMKRLLDHRIGRDPNKQGS